MTSLNGLGVGGGDSTEGEFACGSGGDEVTCAIKPEMVVGVPLGVEKGDIEPSPCEKVSFC